MQAVVEEAKAAVSAIIEEGRGQVLTLNKVVHQRPPDKEWNLPLDNQCLSGL